MINNEFFEKLKEKIQKYFEEGGSHDFSHTQRVYNLAIHIAEEEDADIDIMKAAALLHDIARMKEDDNEVECHAKEGAKMAREILIKTDFPKEKIDDVCNAIEVHRYSSGIIPDKIEAKILQDADRLDALGAITIARMFATGGKIGIPIHKPGLSPAKYKGYSNTVLNGFKMKIMKITPDTFKTKKAQEIAKERYKFVEDFLEQFKKEWEVEL